jgi:signal transduction histidine kinase
MKGLHRQRKTEYVLIALTLSILLLLGLFIHFSNQPPTVVDGPSRIFALLFLATGFILSLYVRQKIALVIDAVAIIAVVWATITTPYYALFLALGFSSMFYFLLRVKGENDLLVKLHQEKQQQLQNALTDLGRVGELKDEMIFVASHDLRTPVSIIRSNLATIKDGYAGEVNAETQKYVDSAFRATERLSGLLEDLLESSVLEQKEELRLNPIQLESVIETVVEEQKGNIGLEIVRPLPPYTMPKVLADQQMLHRALSNLLGNALKFTKQGKITITVKQEGSFVRCDIQDTGIGIAPTEQEQLFTKFFRASNATAANMRGSGLGLYITKQIIQRLRGKITVRSQLDKGTTFSFELPAVKA